MRAGDVGGARRGILLQHRERLGVLGLYPVQGTRAFLVLEPQKRIVGIRVLRGGARYDAERQRQEKKGRGQAKQQRRREISHHAARLSARFEPALQHPMVHGASSSVERMTATSYGFQVDTSQ